MTLRESQDSALDVVIIRAGAVVAGRVSVEMQGQGNLLAAYERAVSKRSN
jgi:hypothetical protein